jgi:hypothetical protein
MGRTSLLLAACLAVLPSAAAGPAGRWTGIVAVPGRDIPITVDLGQERSGAWIGSYVMPGFDVKGSALGHIKVSGDDVAFDAGETLGTGPNAASFDAHLDNPSRMTGHFHQGGNTATFVLERTGAAQVELARQSTRVARDIEGRWIGEYEMNGYPRHVTVDIANREGEPAAVEFVVVGKMTTKVPVDFVAEQEGMLRIESSAYRITFEGRVEKASGRIVGTFDNGLIESPLVLRREGKAS